MCFGYHDHRVMTRQTTRRAADDLGIIIADLEWGLKDSSVWGTVSLQRWVLSARSPWSGKAHGD